MADLCCPTASVVNSSISHAPFILGPCCTSQVPLNAQTGQLFVAHELVKLNPAAPGTFEKLTAAPSASDILAITVYEVDNTAAALAAGRATVRAVVYTAADFDETQLVLPAGVTADDVRVRLIAAGFTPKKPLLIA